MLPARHLAGRVRCRLQALERLRAEHALGDILLARPDQLDRTAHLLGDERAFGGVVAERAPAEAAAHVALVEIHLLVLEAERLRHRLAGFVGRLAALPHLGLVAGIVDADHRVERLHLRVIAVVAAELGVIGLGRAGERGLHVAFLFQLRRLRIRVGVDPHVVLERLVGAEAVGLGLAPGHLQRVAAGLGASRNDRRPRPGRWAA